jgi:hypothetical protein
MLMGSTRRFSLRSGHGRGLGWELITPEKGRTRQRPRAVTPVARPRPSNEGAGQLANTRRYESTTATAQRAGKSGVGGNPISDSRWHTKQLGVGRVCRARAETRTAAPQATPGGEREEVGESSPRRPTGTRRGAAARAGYADRGLRRMAQQGGARSRRWRGQRAGFGERRRAGRLLARSRRRNWTTGAGSIGFGNGVRDCSTGSSHRRLGKTYSSCLAPWRAGPAEQAATGAEPPLRSRADVGAHAGARGRRAEDRASAAGGGGGLHAGEQLRTGKRYALATRRARWAAAWAAGWGAALAGPPRRAGPRKSAGAGGGGEGQGLGRALWAERGKKEGGKGARVGWPKWAREGGWAETCFLLFFSIYFSLTLCTNK